MNTKLLRLPQVIERVGLSRSQLYNLAALGTFPAPIKLSVRASAWLESDIEAWIATRVAQTRNGGGVQ